MTVREYIGARYVPLFMGEWDPTATYEPLSIVEYQGNSYTSRQYVPSNIALTDDRYWAVTGNYNAQIESYRADVARLESDIDQNIGLGNVRRYGAEEQTNGIDWQDIIDQIAQVSEVIDFDGGNWYINEPLVIPSSIVRIEGKGCVITVNSHVDKLFTLDWPYSMRRFGVFEGVTFNGKFNADSLIYTEEGGVNVVNCTFTDFEEYGIQCEELGLMVSNCYFFDSSKGCDKVGVRCGTDSQIYDSRFYHLGIGCEIGTNGIVEGCYFFAQYSTLETKAVSAYNKTGVSKYVSIKNCELDCITHAVENIDRATVESCNFFWNGRDDTLNVPHSIFKLSVDSGMSRLKFINNNISMSMSNPITNKVYTYLTDYPAKNVNNYESYGCVTEFAAATNPHFALTCGFISVSGGIAANNIVKFAPATAVTYNDNLLIESNLDKRVFNKRGNYANNIAFCNTEIASTNANMKAWASNSTAGLPIYWQGPIDLVNRVMIGSGNFYNMEWEYANASEIPVTHTEYTLTVPDYS